MKQVQEKETEDNCSNKSVRAEAEGAAAYLERREDLQGGRGALGGGPVQAELLGRLMAAEVVARGGAAA